MPTGYTSKLYDGEEQTFEDFAMSCARAFGALVTMREAPPDAPIPDEFEPSDYHARQIALAEEQIALIEAWTPEEADRSAKARHAAQMVAWQREEDQRKGRRERYEAMLAEVERWEPPTSEHEELKTFMVGQLTGSIDFDCRGYEQYKPTLKDGATFKADRLAEERRRLERARQGDTEERERARQRTEWVAHLRDSLGFKVA